MTSPKQKLQREWAFKKLRLKGNFGSIQDLLRGEPIRYGEGMRQKMERYETWIGESLDENYRKAKEALDA